jgi:hypothetical protein
MKMESVRECKSKVLSQVASMVAMTTNPMGFGSVSVGITRKGKENILALRADKASAFGMVAGLVHKLVGGECEFKVIPEMCAFGNPDDLPDWRQRKNRPLRIGASIGHYEITAGTTGCFAQKGKTVFVLSNNHVLANCDYAKEGDAIYQPGKHDGGKESDTVAKLTKWVKLQSRGNVVDAAVATLVDGVKYDPSTVHGLGKLDKRVMHHDEIEPGQEVAKFGRTTGKTLGHITAIELDNVRVNYGRRGVLGFKDQIEVTGIGGLYSSGGDSGSCCVMNGSNRPFGLLYAGGGQITLLNYMDAVVKTLGVEIIG